MKRLLVLVVIAGFIFSACTTEKEPPNIVLVFADQLRSFELSSYGGLNIETSNLDQLANEEDPYQMNNLADHPSYLDLIIEQNPKRTMLLDIRELNPDLKL
jgi:hypothetical protein